MLSRYSQIREIPIPNSFQASLRPLRDRLMEHKIYYHIQSLEDLRVFMQHHIFAVWDFMSLLKSLQRKLTCVTIPWVPQGDRLSRRLINDIVLTEESDFEGGGGYISHFELYRAALHQVGADTAPLDAFLQEIQKGTGIAVALKKAHAPMAAQVFVNTTWQIIEHAETQALAAAFTFGREDLIPDMFTPIVEELQKCSSINASLLLDYLERHIQLDSEVHTPMAVQMLANLCGDDEAKWKDALAAARLALKARIALWDGVVEQIELARSKRAVSAELA
jgi:hypothetical protein